VNWDNTCNWCKDDTCVPNTLTVEGNDYRDDIGSNCYIEDSRCLSVDSSGKKLSNRLCELTVRLFCLILYPF
jgi:hypothetical protein